jgi:tRNA splicing endonuclease
MHGTLPCDFTERMLLRVYVASQHLHYCDMVLDSETFHKLYSITRTHKSAKHTGFLATSA